MFQLYEDDGILYSVVVTSGWIKDSHTDFMQRHSL